MPRGHSDGCGCTECLITRAAKAADRRRYQQRTRQGATVQVITPALRHHPRPCGCPACRDALRRELGMPPLNRKACGICGTATDAGQWVAFTFNGDEWLLCAGCYREAAVANGWEPEPKPEPVVDPVLGKRRIKL